MSCENWKITKNNKMLCSCASWQKHIERYSLRAWPVHCSVKECNYAPVVGIPVINHRIDEIKVIPVCNCCAVRSGYFDIKGNVSLVDVNKHDCRVNH